MLQSNTYQYQYQTFKFGRSADQNHLCGFWRLLINPRFSQKWVQLWWNWNLQCQCKYSISITWWVIAAIDLPISGVKCPIHHHCCNRKEKQGPHIQGGTHLWKNPNGWDKKLLKVTSFNKSRILYLAWISIRFVKKPNVPTLERYLSLLFFNTYLSSLVSYDNGLY